ncbi:DNA-binding transcriptional LysR family regulator [Azospirillum agricola]|uniref:LysR family transcriptional regulator n=1 Tax=Azospirillum agricola TaxID=1720247 RepID=UPI001AE92FFA|nr:LysR family transcriptional regulator [Azospirillum agricola]MBP2232765.1 DNA-binding transcriptional LysR family regulator [Azospirillum agricola]
MDRLDELALFVAILDAGSLAGAAKRLGRSAAAVTRGLTALEERLGVRLIERTTRSLAPTEAGRRLAEQARRLLADYDEALLAAGTERPLHGRLRVTAPVMFGRKHVTPLVIGFMRLYRDVRVELVLSDGNLDLIEQELDVAIRIGNLPDSGMVARRVGQVGRYLVASPAYLAERGVPETPEDLAGHDVIVSVPRPVPAEWRFTLDGRERVVRLSPRLAVSHIEPALLAAREGQGIARPLSYQVAEDLAAGTLVRLMPESEPPPLPVQVVVPTARFMPGRVRAFLDHAVEGLSALAVLRG